MADKKDPTVKSTSGGPEYPEGTHEVRSASEVHHSATRMKYSEASDKPDPSTVAQEQDVPKDWW